MDAFQNVVQKDAQIWTYHSNISFRFDPVNLPVTATAAPEHPCPSSLYAEWTGLLPFEPLEPLESQEDLGLVEDKSTCRSRFLLELILRVYAEWFINYNLSLTKVLFYIT